MRAQCSATCENLANRQLLIIIVGHFICHVPQFTIDSIVLVEQYVICAIRQARLMIRKLSAELGSTQKIAKGAPRVSHSNTV